MASPAVIASGTSAVSSSPVHGSLARPRRSSDSSSQMPAGTCGSSAASEWVSSRRMSSGMAASCASRQAAPGLPPRARRSSVGSLASICGEGLQELSQLGGSMGEEAPIMRERRRSWSMSIADPLENYRDSFGNECALEKRVREELEQGEPYQQLMGEISRVEERMQNLVNMENYEECQPVAEHLQLLQLRKRALELAAKPRLQFRVGDVIVHRRYGYRGVIYGHDPECSAPEEWQAAMKIDLLPEGKTQPFYHVLVDTRDRPGGLSTYVAQENIVIQKRSRPVLHNWISKFFVGFHDGVYIPGPKLRQVYPNDW